MEGERVVRILGCDPGLAHVGYALLDGDALLDWGAIETDRDRGAIGDMQRRLEEVGRVLYPLIHRAELVVVEWPGGPGGKFGAVAAQQTSACAGLVTGMAWGAGRKARAPATITWRSRLGAKRGSDRQLHAWLAERYRSELTGLRATGAPHVLDAIGLALYGQTFHSLDDDARARALYPQSGDFQ